MDSATLLKTAVVLLGLTAGGGLVMAIMRFTGMDRPPSWLAMLHGLLAAGGLTLLLYAALAGDVGTVVWTGIALLVLAAIGGTVINLGYHDKGLPLPKSFVIGHAVLAVIGFALISVRAFG
ncbi:MAG: hypothetical protein H0X13_06665 [Ramlibacter sp.]|nr:hypothetical protein [Ramlibacter sp.]